MSLLAPAGTFSFLATPPVQGSANLGGGVHHPLFPFAFNQSASFLHPSNGLSSEDVGDIQSRQLEQLRELESRMESLQPDQHPPLPPTPSRRDRFNARRIQELQRQQLQQLQLQQQQQQQQQEEDSFEKSFNVTTPTLSGAQGPIASSLNGGDVPVLPFLTYPVIQNGTLVQIPVSHVSMFHSTDRSAHRVAPSSGTVSLYCN